MNTSTQPPAPTTDRQLWIKHNADGSFEGVYRWENGEWVKQASDLSAIVKTILQLAESSHPARQTTEEERYLIAYLHLRLHRLNP